MTEYIIANPSGNITALVLSDTPRSDYIKVASEIMSGNKDIEQVGFITGVNADGPAGASPSISMCMAADEFCGNAALSAASYAASLSGIATGERTEVNVSISGADGTLGVHITHKGTSAPESDPETIVETFEGTIEMPSPLSISEYKGMPLINFSGISHLIADASAFSKENALDNIRIIASELGVQALGIMLYDKKAHYMEPLVYVPGVGTLIWEHCCGSGSCALAAYLYSIDRKNTATTVSQPGGNVKIEIIDGKMFLTGQILLYLPRKS